ncbi:MAG TPA: sulfatase-like hydrolase/transferase, partial [Pirellulaceae bacterium]|nr:sulfatase-like hydrolase/transferase [Pirellulaceae bacterium]
VVFTSDNGPWLTQGEQGGSAGLLKDGKGSTWEGGMREPAIAWRPGTVPAGVVSSELASTLDLLPTFCAQAGIEAPKDRPLDGYDITPALAGGKSPRNEMFYYRGFDLMAVRMGPWKAHYMTQTGYGQATPERPFPPLLFNLEVDPGEQFDRGSRISDVLDQIRTLVEKHKAGMQPAASQLEL